MRNIKDIKGKKKDKIRKLYSGLIVSSCSSIQWFTKSFIGTTFEFVMWNTKLSIFLEGRFLKENVVKILAQNLGKECKITWFIMTKQIFPSSSITSLIYMSFISYRKHEQFSIYCSSNGVLQTLARKCIQQHILGVVLFII